jgi:hypothetical protein
VIIMGTGFVAIGMGTGMFVKGGGGFERIAIGIGGFVAIRMGGGMFVKGGGRFEKITMGTGTMLVRARSGIAKATSRQTWPFKEKAT